VLYSLEADYPNFLWLFPAEYGDFLEDCFNIRVNSIRGEAPSLSLSLTGEIPEGLTFCAFLHVDDQVTSVTLDGTSIPWELREGGRLFAVAPEKPWGQHVFEVTVCPMGIESGGPYSGFGVISPCPSGGRSVHVLVSGLETGSPVEIQVHDISGRMVIREDAVLTSGEVHVQPEEALAPGMYFITVISGDLSGRSRTVVIP